MKLSKLIFTIICASVLFAGCNTVNNDEPDKVEGQIPILAWEGLLSEKATVERYREMADAGFTIDYSADLVYKGNLPAERYFSVLDAAHTAGIKVVVSIKVLEKFSDADIVRLKAHPALLGYNLGDEPYAKDFAALGEQIKKAKEKDDTHPFYSNLDSNKPSHYGHKTLTGSAETTSYREHVQYYLSQVPVTFLSFDHYPIEVFDDNPKRVLRAMYYENLEIISDEAKKAGLPFWAFALSTAHWSYPVPTLDDLRLQVYSDLAYGAQCIQYYTYWTPYWTRRPYHDGPLDAEGNKTPTYDVVKAMNGEIKALSKVFLGSKMVWAAHTDKVPQGCKEFNKSQLPAVIKDVEVSKGGGVLISLLERGKDNFLVIVNHDINEEAVVKVSAEASVRMIKKDGTVTDANGESHTLTPGDILVHFWKTK